MRSKTPFLIATANFLVISALDTAEVMASKRQLEDDEHSSSRQKIKIEPNVAPPSPQHELIVLQQLPEEIAEGQAPSTPVQPILSSGNLEQRQLDKAIMHLVKKTDDLTDDQAVQYFQQALNSPHLSQTKKDRAAFELAGMRLHNRTTVITDDQAGQYFLQTLNSSYLSQKAKDDAARGLAEMRYLNRTTVISDPEAVKMLGKIILSSDDVSHIKKAADLIKKLTDRM